MSTLECCNSNWIAMANANSCATGNGIPKNSSGNNPALAVRKWQQEGNINLDRAKWVADGVRGISKPQRDALLRSVATARFAPP